MTTTPSAWSDIPSSSELFGGELFSDELMEMYRNSAAGDDNDHDHVISSLLGDSPVSVTADNVHIKKEDNTDPTPTEDEATKHPGVAVALKAAAMDDGLDVLGTASDFDPIGNVSNESLTSFVDARTNAGTDSLAKATQSQSPAAPNPAASSKRPAAAAAAAVAPQELPSKKHKGPVTLPATNIKHVSDGTVHPGTRARLFNGPVPASVCSSSVNLIHTSPTCASASPGTAFTPSSIARHNAPKPGATLHKERSSAGIAPSRNFALKPPVVTSSHVLPAASSLVAPPPPPPAVTNVGVAVITPNTNKSQTTAPVGDPAVPPKRPATEADFKDVAHAAVSNLIQNATIGMPGAKLSGPSKISGVKPSPLGKVNTSTAHVNALTSQNWANACNPIPQNVESSTNACDKVARNVRRASLTQEERAKQNRDRNREHARNTRLRKKAYVEELKRTLTEIVAQRDATELEKRHSAQREREQREVRFRVMEEFLKLRGRNELNASRWVAILEDGFVLTLPKTNYRKMVGDNLCVTSGDGGGSSGRNNPSSSDIEQSIRGATAVMEDSQFLSAFLQTIGGDSSASHHIQIVHRCDRKRFFMDGNITFMDFVATTIGAVNKGAENELVFKGSMRASFSPASNKLISVDITFDTGSITCQLERLSSAQPTGSVSVAAAAAAAAAAHEADALLDSLQMPQIYVENKNAVGTVSVSSDDSERSYDSGVEHNP